MIIKETFLNERKLIQNLNPINNINNNISTQKELNKEKDALQQKIYTEITESLNK